MNLIVDIGNTSTKLAVYDGWKKVSVLRINELRSEELERSLSGLKISKAIISTVKKLTPSISELFLTRIPIVHFLSHKSKLPFRSEYETPKTLGTDRIAAVAGTVYYFSGAEILIIDAGTAVTYDYLSNNTYKGGNISPGLMIRFKALNKFTGKLPLAVPKDNYTIPGLNTIDAITAGVITGLTYEINEYIRTFEEKHTNNIIILTGGDSGYLKNKINYQLTYMPDIVIDGLNYILEYNAT
jgi:type III pantothenate kinase